MSFIWPAMLALLVAIPLGVVVYVAFERRRQRRVAAYGAFAVAARRDGPAGQAGPDGPRRTPGRFRRRLPGVLMLAGMSILVVALARPQSVVSLPRIEGTVILAFDVSGSMAADDLEPSRMEAAKAAARSFVERQPSSIRIGVVAFSDSGFSIQVPTNDPTLVVAAINRLAPERGTAIARGILTSLTTIAAADDDPAAGFYTNRSPGPTPEPTPVPNGTYAPAAIVLLTDGENNQRPDPIEAAQAAANRGVRIFTVGIGSAEGATLEVEGFKVHSQLDESMLRQISDVTDGAYYAADDPAELAAIYDQIDTRLVIRPEAMEITSLFAGVGILVLVIGGVASLLWLGRLP
jgi:Ca-activated chloride channel family protein